MSGYVIGYGELSGIPKIPALAMGSRSGIMTAADLGTACIQVWNSTASI